jgi:hypothetical protein
MNILKKAAFISLAAIVLVFSGCGGGGSNTSNAAADATTSLKQVSINVPGVVQKLPILGNTDEQIPAAHEGGV